MSHDLEQEVTIEDLENTIEVNKFASTQNTALQRLLKSRDFKTVILEGYFKTFACEQVMARANPSCQSEKQQANLLRSIDGISELRAFLDMIHVMGHQAEDNITAANHEIDLMRAEESTAPLGE